MRMASISCNLPPGMSAMDLETGRSIDETGEVRALNAERLQAAQAQAEADEHDEIVANEGRPEEDRPGPA